MAASSSPPLECVALTALRRLTCLRGADLADDVGVSATMMSRYEATLAPPADVLARALAAMGYDRMDYDKVLAVLSEAVARAAERRGEAPPPMVTPVHPTPAEWHDIRANASEAGWEAEKLAKETLAEAVCEQKAAADRAEAETLCARLETEPKPWLVVEKVREVQTWAVAERLAHRSADLAADRPGRAADLAALACRVAELATCSGPFRQSLLGYTLAYRENTTRAAGDLATAAALFANAEALWSAGAAVPGPLAAWRRYSLAGSLLRDQGRLAESLTLLDAALEAAPAEARLRIQVTRALTLERMGKADQAIELLEEVEQAVDRRQDPDLFFIVRVNHASALCRLGRFGQANLLLPEIEGMAKQLGPGLNRIRLRWLRGTVAAGLGHLEKAEAALDAARRELAAHKADWECALVSLELAAVLCRAGKPRQLADLARQLAPLCEHQKFSREAREAVQTVRDAIEHATLTRDLAEQALKRLQNAPKADTAETPRACPAEKPAGESELTLFSGAASAPAGPSAPLVSGGNDAVVTDAPGIDQTAAVQALGAGRGLGEPGSRGPEADDPGDQAIQEAARLQGGGPAGRQGG